MTLIDRYVGDVARRLPRSQRSDVARELESSLLDALDNRFGPNASEADVVTLLKEFGPPAAMAALYRPSSQYLIGPEWYPTFSLVIRIHLLSLLAVLAAGAVLLVIFAPSGDEAGATAHALLADRLWGLTSGLVQYGLIGLGVVTLIFHLLERGDVRSPRDADLHGRGWDPRDLPVVGQRDRVGRAEATVVVVCSALALVLLHQFTDYIGFWWGAQRPLLNNVVRANVPWLTALWVATMPLYAVLAWQGYWRWYTRLSRLAIDVLFVFVVYRIATGIAAEQDTLLAAGMPPIFVTAFVRGAAVTALVVAGSVVVDTVRMFIRAWQDHGDTSASGPAVSAQGARH